MTHSKQYHEDAAMGAALRKLTVKRVLAHMYPALVAERSPLLDDNDGDQCTLDAIRALCAAACDSCDGTGEIEADHGTLVCGACDGSGASK